VTSGNRKRLSGNRVIFRLVILALVGVVAAAATATLGSGAVARTLSDATSVSIFVSPNPISIGDAVTVSGTVYEGPLSDLHELIVGGNVVVTRYSGPGCTLVATKVASLTTGAAGEYSFTETPRTPPPLSYRIAYTGGGGDFDADDPTGVGEDFFPSESDCVTVGSTQELSGATAIGKVSVDGRAFKRGVIDYGSEIAVAPGATLKLGSSVGYMFVYPTGGQTSFVATRTTIPTPTRRFKHRRAPVVVLRLVGGDFGTCGAHGLRQLAGATKPKPKRSLWAHGKGHYRTVGNVSSATARGTYWLTQDTCAGTLTRVLVGVVEVHDFASSKTVYVTAGHSYLAKAPQD
jgi:hypothetical protein